MRHEGMSHESWVCVWVYESWVYESWVCVSVWVMSVSVSVWVMNACSVLSIVYRTGFARDSGYEPTFSKLPKVIQAQWKWPKQKDFYILINISFNSNRLSLLSNVVGGCGDKCRRLLPTSRKCRRKYYWVILVPGIFSPTFLYDSTPSWPRKQTKPKIWLVQRFKPRSCKNVRFFLIWPDSAAKPVIGLFRVYIGIFWVYTGLISSVYRALSSVHRSLLGLHRAHFECI